METPINILNENKIYQVYIKDKCIYDCLNKDQFETIWNDLNNMVGIIHTDYNKNDLSFEALNINATTTRNSSL